MPLSVQDMAYLEDKFQSVYDTIAKLDDKVDEAKTDTCTRLTKLETEYKFHAQRKVKEATDKYKFSTIGVAIGTAIIGVFQFIL